MSRNYTNITSVQEFFLGANTGSNGTFWTVTLYMVWIVLLGTMLKFGFVRAVISSSFISIIIGMLLVMLDAVSMFAYGFFLGICLLIILYTAFTNND